MPPWGPSLAGTAGFEPATVGSYGLPALSAELRAPRKPGRCRTCCEACPTSASSVPDRGTLRAFACQWRSSAFFPQPVVVRRPRVHNRWWCRSREKSPKRYGRSKTPTLQSLRGSNFVIGYGSRHRPLRGFASVRAARSSCMSARPKTLSMNVRNRSPRAFAPYPCGTILASCRRD